MFADIGHFTSFSIRVCDLLAFLFFFFLGVGSSVLKKPSLISYVVKKYGAK